MTSHEEFVDVHVDDFRDKLPLLLRKNPRASAFLHAFSDQAAVIVEAAAVLGEAEATYAKQRIAEVMIAFGRETSPQVV